MYLTTESLHVLESLGLDPDIHTSVAELEAYKKAPKLFRCQKKANFKESPWDIYAPRLGCLLLPRHKGLCLAEVRWNSTKNEFASEVDAQTQTTAIRQRLIVLAEYEPEGMAPVHLRLSGL